MFIHGHEVCIEDVHISLDGNIEAIEFCGLGFETAPHEGATHHCLISFMYLLRRTECSGIIVQLQHVGKGYRVTLVSTTETTGL
jgi:hypothetical protein